MNGEVERLIQQFDLEPHPEGGYFRRTYESPYEFSSDTLPGSFEGTRRAGSVILYLLPETEVSRLHRLESDEMWHFYSGSTLTLHVFHADDSYVSVDLGTDYQDGQTPQYTVPAGASFGATVEEGYALVGCTVWPEFQYEDYIATGPDELLSRFPDQSELIEALT